MLYLRLFWEFFKTGLFAIGGGMATIPFLYDMSAATGWFTSEDVANMIAVGESTPGPIGVNMATYVGCAIAGIPGGIIATLGEVLPSVVIISVVSMYLNKFRDNKLVGYAPIGGSQNWSIAIEASQREFKSTLDYKNEFRTARATQKNLVSKSQNK